MDIIILQVTFPYTDKKVYSKMDLYTFNRLKHIIDDM
jgi:hypothetical protein